MGVKGYRTTVGLVSDLFSEESYRAFSINLLNGLDLLETPKAPRRYEVDTLRSAWVTIANGGGFDCAKAKDNFFMFLNLGSDEMDACMFGEKELQEGKKTHVWLDIEVKTALRGGIRSEIETVLNNQVDSHAQDVMPTFFRDIMCVSVGFVDGDFASAKVHYQGATNSLSETEFYSFMKEVDWSDNGLSYIQQITGIGNIRDIIQKIENGTFKWHVDTLKKIDSLDRKLQTERFILCYGDAGSGKSVLATSLFMRHRQDTNKAKMLVINQKFYKVLSMDRFYNNKECFYGSDQFLNALTSDSVAIIDEAQRVSMDYLAKVLAKAKCLIAFGDQRQSFYYTDNLNRPMDIVKDIESQTGVIGQYIPIRSPKRYDDAVATALESLTKLDTKPQAKKGNLNNYSVRVMRDFDEFMDAYTKDDSSRMFIPHGDRDSFLHDSRIKERELQLLGTEDSDFYSGKKYVGDTFHAISFDVDNSYIYLPNLTLGNLYNKKDVLTEDRLSTVDEKQRFLNELNILFTRGLKSLTIYVPNAVAYLHIISVLKNSGIF